MSKCVCTYKPCENSKYKIVNIWYEHIEREPWVRRVEFSIQAVLIISPEDNTNMKYLKIIAILEICIGVHISRICTMNVQILKRRWLVET